MLQDVTMLQLVTKLLMIVTVCYSPNSDFADVVTCHITSTEKYYDMKLQYDKMTCVVISFPTHL